MPRWLDAAGVLFRPFSTNKKLNNSKFVIIWENRHTVANAIERPRTGEKFTRVNTPEKHKKPLQGITGLYKGIIEKLSPPG